MPVEIKVRPFGKELRAIDIERAYPLIEIARLMAARVRQRVSRFGLTRQGKLKRYGAAATDGKPETRFYVGPHKKHPPHPERIIHRGRKWKGWASYPNYKTYLKAGGREGEVLKLHSGAGGGALWESLTVSLLGPRRVKIAFTKSKKEVFGDGTYRRVQHRVIVNHHMKGQRQVLFAPLDSELRAIQKIVAESITEQMLVDAAAGSRQFKLNKRVGRLNRRASKLLGDVMRRGEALIGGG